MGTRGIFGLVCDGEEKLMYNHWDSYPDSLGNRVTEFISHVNEVNGLDVLRDKCSALKLMDENKKPTATQKRKYKRYADTSVGGGSLDDWYVLLRNLQSGHMLWELYGGYVKHITDNKKFMKDGVFCEYAYIIDLDKESFIFHDGCNEEPRIAPLEKVPEGNWLQNLFPYYKFSSDLNDLLWSERKELSEKLGISEDAVKDIAKSLLWKDATNIKLGAKNDEEYKEMLESIGYTEEDVKDFIWQSDEKKMEHAEEIVSKFGGGI